MNKQWPQEEAGRLVSFFLQASALKKMARRGWALKLGIPKPESVADHSFSVALLSYIMARAQGLDAEKALRLALIHDLHEAVYGDKTPEENRAGEEQALKRMLKPLPPPIRKELQSSWNEASSKATAEARLVGEADKLEMAAQALLYEEEGWSPRQLDEFWRSAKEAINSPPARQLYAALESRRQPRVNR